MKKFVCILVLGSLFLPLHSQIITGMSVYPHNPTSTDHIQVIVETMFGSGSCSDWYIFGQSGYNFEYTL